MAAWGHAFRRAPDLYGLLSFAQFEREVIGERVRDKIAASKRKGIWVGGPVPLGYAAVAKTSPRGRGNLQTGSAAMGNEGTIPARAGKPFFIRVHLGRQRDHPRAGGETDELRTLMVETGGPSPRGRGNLLDGWNAQVDIGTIPARAGKPDQRHPAAEPGRDHPRAGGETP
jgi:hypothetical protein